MFTVRTICRRRPRASRRKCFTCALFSIWWNCSTSSSAAMSCWILRPASVESWWLSDETSCASFVNHSWSRGSLVVRVSACSPEKKCASSVIDDAHACLALPQRGPFSSRSRFKTSPSLNSSCAVWRRRSRILSGLSPALITSRSFLFRAVRCSMAHRSVELQARSVWKSFPALSRTSSSVRTPSRSKSARALSCSSTRSTCFFCVSFTCFGSSVFLSAAFAALYGSHMTLRSTTYPM
mmetsp:Transcript_14781/g.35101  ORF Transcript_14781/g.35101 Transcript_14781/m.35101 type:complete len:238 (-) Transcript_14781:1125-1838(-)